MKPRLILVAGAVWLALMPGAAALAQIPDAPNCKLDQPPPEAGAYATPGGFLLVHPRNVHLSDDYTGCKVIWVVDAPERFNRLMTLYFERGKLRAALGYDGRGANQLRATCTLPDAKRECSGVESHPLSALKLATWPRSCMTRPDAPECKKPPD
jgi:hypothetical protein